MFLTNNTIIQITITITCKYFFPKKYLAIFPSKVIFKIRGNESPNNRNFPAFRQLQRPESYSLRRSCVDSVRGYHVFVHPFAQNSRGTRLLNPSVGIRFVKFRRGQRRSRIYLRLTQLPFSLGKARFIVPEISWIRCSTRTT